MNTKSNKSRKSTSRRVAKTTPRVYTHREGSRRSIAHALVIACKGAPRGFVLNEIQSGLGVARATAKSWYQRFK